MRKLVVIAALALISGCAWIPSPLRVFGDPISREAKAQKKEDAARDVIYEKARESAHKTQDALKEVKTPSRETDVAEDFADETVALLDQARGPVMLEQLNRWQAQVSQLCSTDQNVRMKADFERSKERLENERASAKLDQLEKRAAQAEEKAIEFAKVKDRQADIILKFVWGCAAIAILWILSQIFTIVARFNPAFGGVATAINTIAAPAAHYAYKKAVTGIQQIGAGMAAVRKELPDVAEHVARILDAHVDQEHKTIAGAAASAAGAPPL